MDISFDILNSKGDQVRVALSYYDTASLQAITDDPLTLTLIFYDVALLRISGGGNVGVKMLNAVCEVLYKFLKENERAVLCFYCDDLTDVYRHDNTIPPQEYRSRLFSKMFDKYTYDNNINDVINYRVHIQDGLTPRFAHFITPKEYLPAVKRLEDKIMEK